MLVKYVIVTVAFTGSIEKDGSKGATYGGNYTTAIWKYGTKGWSMVISCHLNQQLVALGCVLLAKTLWIRSQHACIGWRCSPKSWKLAVWMPVSFFPHATHPRCQTSKNKRDRSIASAPPCLPSRVKTCWKKRPNCTVSPGPMRLLLAYGPSGLRPPHWPSDIAGIAQILQALLSANRHMFWIYGSMVGHSYWPRGYQGDALTFNKTILRDGLKLQ